MTENPDQTVVNKKEVLAEHASGMVGSGLRQSMLGLGPSLTISLSRVLLFFLFLHFQEYSLPMVAHMSPSSLAYPTIAFLIRPKSPGSYFHWPSGNSAPICDPIK